MEVVKWARTKKSEMLIDLWAYLHPGGSYYPKQGMNYWINLPNPPQLLFIYYPLER